MSDSECYYIVSFSHLLLIVIAEDVTMDLQQNTVGNLPSNGEVPTGIVEAMTYAGLVYYEQDGVEDLVTFTAAKNLNALLQVQ